MGEVVEFTGITKLDIDPKKVIRHFVENPPKKIFVIAWGDEDDDKIEYYSSVSNKYEVSYMVQDYLHRCFNGDFS